MMYSPPMGWLKDSIELGLNVWRNINKGWRSPCSNQLLLVREAGELISGVPWTKPSTSSEIGNWYALVPRLIESGGN